jgi:hypothetical protein
MEGLSEPVVYKFIPLRPYRVRPEQLDVSLLASCKLSSSRIEMFLQAYSSWQKVHGVSEIIIVDWFSPISILATIAKRNKLWRFTNVQTHIVHVSRRSSDLSSDMHWRISAAVNLGLSYVSQRYLLKVDCDTWLHKDFLQLQSLSNVGFLRGDWQHAKDENEKHLNGIFFARLEHLKKVNGYDERLDFYGWDDSDLYLRLAQVLQKDGFSVISANLTMLVRGKKAIVHLKHPRSKDASDENFGECINRQSISQARVWNGTSKYCYNVLQRTRHGHIFLHELEVSHVVEAIQRTIDHAACIWLVHHCSVHAGVVLHNVAETCGVTWEEVQRSFSVSYYLNDDTCTDFQFQGS